MIKFKEFINEYDTSIVGSMQRDGLLNDSFLNKLKSTKGYKQEGSRTEHFVDTTFSNHDVVSIDGTLYIMYLTGEYYGYGDIKDFDIKSVLKEQYYFLDYIIKRNWKFNGRGDTHEEVMLFDVDKLKDSSQLPSQIIKGRIPLRVIFFDDSIDDEQQTEAINRYIDKVSFEITGVLKSKIKLNSGKNKCDFEIPLKTKKLMLPEYSKLFPSLAQVDLKKLINNATLGKTVIKKGISNEDIINLLEL